MSTDPDVCVESLIGYQPDPFRYNTDNRDPDESTMMVASLVAEKSTVLDVGCGIGAIASALTELRGATVIGIEPNGTRASAARSRGVRVVEGYLNDDVATSLGVFDFVILADVLEHLVDPAGMLRVVKQMIHEDGYLVISVPNVAHWSIRRDLLLGRFNYTDCGLLDATHLRWFTLRSLLGLVTWSGFECIDIRHTIGLGLGVYQNSRIWRRVPKRFQRVILRKLCDWFPTFFACQFVLRLRKHSNPSEEDR